MRGQKLFEEIITAEELEHKSGRGRDAELSARRNDKLLHRYYYYAIVLRVRIDVLWEKLEWEFDIAQFTCQNIVRDNADKLRQMRNTPPTLEQLKDKYPYWVWDADNAVKNA